MSFDGLFTKSMVNELQPLIGGRINKVHQPYKLEILLNIRANGKNQKLLLSSHPSYARVQLTEQSYDNPTTPPMFCMLLRKHLEGYIIENIYQKDLERMIIMEVKGRNEIGDISYKQLIIEIMGRHSNIILVDKERGMILDSIKHVSFALNSYRSIVPGQTYKYPPAQEKNNPLVATKDDILRTLDFTSGKLDKQIVNAYSGVSPLLAKEIIFRAGLANRDSVPTSFVQVLHHFNENILSPSLMVNEKEYFYAFPINHTASDVVTFPSLSSLLDRFYDQKAERDRVKQQGHDLERLLKNEREKNVTKITKLEDTQREAANADTFQLYGELLTANMYQIKQGMKEISVVNYYEEDGSTITITLDPRKSPSDNAQKYFTKYQKSKTALKMVAVQIEKALEEIEYLDTLIQQLESASTQDLEEIREELREEGYLKKVFTKKKKSTQKPNLDEYRASDGTTILVGKNNKQNDYLTNKLAHREDIWLHTKDIPGSHVVIRSNDPSEETILEAAILSAYFSKAKESSSVPVDFTKIKHVKKPNGSKPGFVTYDHQQTVFVTPSIDQVRALKA
ncbi:hypothetical protein Q75_05855 [Bacillus coahuilensis p1.1.43]|uniref:Rqc2 homolog RqcH n=1 Tax=Bacillus coahuilensis p1.1.43 TaxID=1150625 RepID=A0A147K9L2_9BACI|nr:NFACT RNA binding domain-containing protein [Bacillus coahuilensis]KUP07053.1 hypothetical protein Q75_05855 [Bacillus coahuilensis p1.1.43]